VLKVPDWRGPLTALSARQPAVEEIAPGEYRIDLGKGEEVVVFPREKSVTPVVHALPLAATSAANPFGVKRGGELKNKQFWHEVPVPSTSAIISVN